MEWRIMSQQSTAWHSWTLQNTLWYNITLHRLSWQGTATHNNQMHLNTTTCHSPTQHSVMCISSLPDRVFFPVTADHNKAQHNTVSCAFLPSLTECCSLSQQITTKPNTTQCHVHFFPAWQSVFPCHSRSQQSSTQHRVTLHNTSQHHRTAQPN